MLNLLLPSLLMIRNIMAAPLIKAIVELQTMYGKFSQEKNMVFMTRVFLTLVAGLLNLSFHSSGGLASGRLDQSQIHSVPGSLDSWSSLFGLWGLLGLPWAEDSLLFARDGLLDSFWASINSFSTSVTHLTCDTYPTVHSSWKKKWWTC